MIRERVYLIKCNRMERSERLIVRTVPELFMWIERYMEQHGDLELLFRES